MVDPVSITSLVLQAAVVIGQVYNFGKQIKEAKNEIRDLYVELLALKGILEQMKTEEESLISDPWNQEMAQMFLSQPVLDAFNTSSNLLSNILVSLEKTQAPRHKSIKTLGWPLLRNELQTQIKQLERLKSYFVLVMLKDTLCVAPRVLRTHICLTIPLRTLERDVMSEIRQISDTLQEEHEMRRWKDRSMKISEHIRHTVS